MNLTTEPWIPIVWQNGHTGMVSLNDAFVCGNEIRDLALRPHERIALMRLLICIAQAALDGPANYDGWKTSAPQITTATSTYLKKWQHAFELFGNGQRFLQVGKLKRPTKNSGGEDEEGNPTSKLDVALATGNNPTLFDNAGGSIRSITLAQLALNMLTFQCFSPCGTIGVAIWNGKPTIGWKKYPEPAPGQSDHAPCIAANMLHALLRGKDLLDTVHRNLMTKHQAKQFFGEDSWGKPVWEQMPNGLDDAEALRNATRTYLGRLVPLTRAISFTKNGDSLILANGLEYAPYPAWRESTATIVIRGKKNKPERKVLQASVDEAPWRELHALTVKTTSQNTNGGPAALQNIFDEKPFDLWVGGLVAAGNGKLVDSTESVFHIPSEMFTERRQQIYEQGVRLAEKTEFRLKQAVATFHCELGNDLDRAKLLARQKATTHYWTDAEQHVNELLAVAENHALLGLDVSWQKTDWGRTILRAARTAYDYACSKGTPRKMRAYVLGLNDLFDVSGKNTKLKQKRRRSKHE